MADRCLYRIHADAEAIAGGAGNRGQVEGGRCDAGETTARATGDDLGATTIRKQLAKHRDLPQCANCHTLIDPHGFALENFDVIGGWRDNYRSIGQGEPAIVNGRKMRYLNGPQVESADELLNGGHFQSIQEYKKLLVQNRDELAKAFARKLLSYATGANTTLADRESLDAVIDSTKQNNFGVRSIVHAIVDTPTFRMK